MRSRKICSGRLPTRSSATISAMPIGIARVHTERVDSRMAATNFRSTIAKSGREAVLVHPFHEPSEVRTFVRRSQQIDTGEHRDRERGHEHREDDRARADPALAYEEREQQEGRDTAASTPPTSEPHAGSPSTTSTKPSSAIASGNAKRVRGEHDDEGGEEDRRRHDDAERVVADAVQATVRGRRVAEHGVVVHVRSGHRVDEHHAEHEREHADHRTVRTRAGTTRP